MLENMKWFMSFLDGLGDGAYEINLNGDITLANNTCEIITDMPLNVLIGSSFYLQFSAESQKKAIAMFEKTIRGESPEYESKLRNGRLCYFKNIPLCDHREKTVGIFCMLRDLTEQKQTENFKIQFEKQLRNSQKMEAIGTLAAGIAHDFNNILGAILLNTELAMKYIPEDHENYQRLNEVIKSSHRAKLLVEQILTFSRQTNYEKKSIQLIPLIKETTKFFRASCPSSIDIRNKITTENDRIIGDPSQIHQLLMNLCNNARYAIKNNSGLIEINLAEKFIKDHDSSTYPELTPGYYLILTVKDNGSGIDEKIMDRIYEPFFTTKNVGEGTGLGLSVVHGIVKSLNGDIFVSSRPGKGTIVDVFIPGIESTSEEINTSNESIPGGTERILFVDDEESLVRVISNVLKSFGYSVTGTTSSLEALDIFREQPYNFDIVLTDLTMPQLRGIDLADKLIKIRPDIPIILFTGYNDTIEGEKIKKSSIKKLLFKPISSSSLAENIRQILDLEK